MEKLHVETLACMIDCCSFAIIDALFVSASTPYNYFGFSRFVRCFEVYNEDVGLLLGQFNSIEFKIICIALFTIQLLQSSFTGN